VSMTMRNGSARTKSAGPRSSCARMIMRKKTPAGSGVTRQTSGLNDCSLSLSDADRLGAEECSILWGSSNNWGERTDLSGGGYAGDLHDALMQ
jgi:hypothetical protein